MTSERTEELSGPRAANVPMPADDHAGDAHEPDAPVADATQARAGEPHSAEQNPGNSQKGAPPPKPRETAPAKLELRERLPSLQDDVEVGIEREHLVARDGKADLTFIGTLLAAAAARCADKAYWQEYRIFHTSGGKHVFSKVTRTVYADENDKHEADVFDPAPASIPSQILKSAREIAHSRTLTWKDAAVAFFGYDPLAKVLYRKLDVRFEEQIS